VSKFIGQTNEFHLHRHTSDWLKQTGLNIPEESDSIAHVRPHDIEIIKAVDENSPIILKDWQHLGALIRVELTKKLHETEPKTVYAEMPNEQFKRLDLNRGDRVELKIRQAHWFN
jgi:sulfate transport system ATP-binding protein